MDDDQISSQETNREDQVLPKNNDDGESLSLKKNGEDRISPNKKQVDNENLHKDPYADVYTFKETDSFTTFTKKNYKVSQ